MLRSGARWKDLPSQSPSPATCWRRLQEWEDAGVWLTLWRKFLGELVEQGILSWDETFSDGTFSPAKKWAPTSEIHTCTFFTALPPDKPHPSPPLNRSIPDLDSDYFLC